MSIDELNAKYWINIPMDIKTIIVYSRYYLEATLAALSRLVIKKQILLHTLEY